MKILVVCLGNICRSPLAEGLLQRAADARDLPWTVDSAGTGDYHVGEAPDPRSVAVAARHGLDISQQRARQLTAADLDRYDLLLAMDAQNYQHIRRLATTDEQRDKVKLILNYTQPGRNAGVPDPYWDDDGFLGVYRLLEEACAAVCETEG